MSKNLVSSSLWLFVLLLLHHLCPPVSADFTSVKIINDSRPYIHLKDFCFSNSGHLSISLTSFSITGTTAPPANSSHFGLLISNWFYLYTGKLPPTKQEGVDPCFVDQGNVFLSLSNPNKSVSISEDDKYNIFFRNCAPSGTFVNLEVEVETYNLDENGNKSYLSDWETLLPDLLFGYSLFYVVFVFLWVYHCYRNIPFVRRIHVLMAALLAVKCATLFISGEEKYHIKVTGRPHGWKIYLYIFHTIRTVLFWTVIMLIGSGWSYLKPLLQLKEKIMLATGIVIQVVLNICYIYVDEIGQFTENYIYWVYALMVIDLASFVVAAIPYFWFLVSLKEVANEDGKAARTLQRMRLINYILGAVALYGYITRSYLFLFNGNDFICNPDTLMAIISETSSIVLFGVVFYVLRPVEHNEYVIIEDEETALRAIEREFDGL